MDKNIHVELRTRDAYLILAVLLAIVLSFSQGAFKTNTTNIVELDTSRKDIIMQQACIEVEDCEKGWGCKRKTSHQLVGKCVLVTPLKEE